MAHDIVQDTWIALTKYSQIEDEIELLKLAFKISHYTWLRAKKKTGRELPPPEEWNPAGHEPRSDDRAFLIQVRAAVQGLTGRCPELLLLYLDGFTADEIKVKLRAPRTGTVHVWVHRCIGALRNKLAVNGGG